MPLTSMPTPSADDQGDVVIYTDADGNAKINVRFVGDTVWLTQAQMGQLFQCGKSNISEHIKNIFAEGELDEISVVRKLRTTAADGKAYLVAHYNLDMIISLGYRVKSAIATRFRRWATERLKEYIVKGFAMDDERLKRLGGGDYWKELLDRIRDIRSSEKVLYRQVLDLYATSVDYNPTSDESRAFFKIVQNKLHYAAHGHTAAEVIFTRVDADADFMGMRSFDGEFPTLKDAEYAKNYLTKDELKALNGIVSGYFDFAEVQAMKRVPMLMRDYIEQLDRLLQAANQPVLTNAGTVSHGAAMQKMREEYNRYVQKNLSPVEKAYLQTVKSISAIAKKKGYGDSTKGESK